MKDQRKQKGITLVALVVTIIILLILAGITIGILGGENGLIEKNKKIKKENIDIDTIEFSYKQTEKNEENVKILIKISDKVNGINTIEIIDENRLISCGGKKEIAIDVSIKVGVKYKYKIRSMSGEEKEKIILIEPTITETTPIINTTTNATNSAGKNSIKKGTTLYINFSATIDITGGTITSIINKEDGNSVPYAVTKNGIYTFIITGIYEENKILTKEVEILVNQYFSATNVVKYDAGEWTESEIQSLQTAGLYNLNASKTANTEKGLNFTFGGFTYKGDTENLSYINNGTIITSRNQSVDPQSGYGTPKYDGWQLLETEKKQDENGNIIKNEDGTDRIYVKKIVHAGCPENFVFFNTTSYDNMRAEYILSNGLRQINYNTYSPRSWQMYIDDSQKDLIADATDKDGNTVKDIHAMTYEEGNGVTGSNWTTDGIRNTGAFYWLSNAHNNSFMWRVHGSNGAIDCNSSNCFGVRPVVSLKSRVYIKNGEGTEESPYILGIE